MTLVRNYLLDALTQATKPLRNSSAEAESAFSGIELDIPKSSQHGDYASNVAMAFTRSLKRKPREIAAEIVKNFEDREQFVDKIEIAGPGFLNFFIKPHAWHGVLVEIHQQGENYGRQNVGHGERVQVEFVSANPTGPLHIGHGRGAATGDALASILKSCGYQVECEYYINDAGNQMETLGRSLYYRYQQLLGEPVEFPEKHYQGDYMIELARDMIQEVGNRHHRSPLPEVLAEFTDYAAGKILAGIRDDLDTFGVTYDTWFSERSLHDEDAIGRTIAALEAAGYVYLREGAKWFRSTAFGDEKDRVVIRANGVSTYFAADLAYHKNKFERGYDKVVDIWGADHHGYVERMLAGVQALGRRRNDLRIILVQLVNLLRAGKPVAMSTRAGEFDTLREVMEEVGKDAARFIFLTRRSDSPLDFDLEVAKMQSNDNPVYYVQYAHARLCSVFEVVKERGIQPNWLTDGKAPQLALLNLPQEMAIIKMLGEYPEVVLSSAKSLEPHRIPYYLHELVSMFHSYYNQNRIIGDDPDLTQARLYLAAAARLVIGNALRLLGVTAPQKM
jgi:arginyl-tRNA synthetase